MASSSPYPKDLDHPNGFKTVTVYDADEERAFQKESAAWRKAHQASGDRAIAEAAAIRTGKPLPPTDEFTA